ncbi:MAG: hypothetical protein DLM65_08090 [Candidatus Aeolococcus gillhamiae]|uniref:Uncharacterized protein n=1 Tax=Candidatus Aeolococcus gillhamiae TaxID=3127015 RepID=A0A2W5Z8P7_9BACT|nr:MAG: hypothetical protein DLM65_08090 [Candidatus Dormibacter sp. RRmetagenome_bin12]
MCSRLIAIALLIAGISGMWQVSPALGVVGILGLLLVLAARGRLQWQRAEADAQRMRAGTPTPWVKTYRRAREYAQDRRADDRIRRPRSGERHYGLRSNRIVITWDR